MGMFTSMTEVKKFSEPMELESTVMLHEYLQEPDNYFQHHARFTNSVVMMVAFGRRTEKDDKLVVSHRDCFADAEHDSGSIYPGSRSNATRSNLFKSR
jgi:hypothetical protein